MRIEEQIMKLQTYKMYEGEDTVYVERDDILKLIEQQPCEDAISRAAVITKIEDEDSLSFMGVFCDHNAAMGFREEIKELPSVTPQQTRWIPVSERLPEDNIHVLCQFTLSGMGECYLAHGVFHVVGGVVMTCNEVIAWMPLPEPYEAESEGAE